MQRPDLIIFEQGEKAKAAEVNQNFEELGDYIQGSISEVNTTVTNAINSLQTLANSAAPTGVVQAYSGSTAPSGWLLCEGQAVSRTQYSGLFAVIGTTFGGGDGTTTFNVPNMIDRYIQGATTPGVTKEAALPQHTHTVYHRSSWPQGLSGSGAPYDIVPNSTTGTEHTTGKVISTGGGAIYKDDCNTVTPPTLTMKYIIKT